MAGKRVWGGRFLSQEDPLFAEFNRSLPFDRALLEADIEGSRAYARALERAGVLTTAERQALDNGLRQIQEEYGQDPQRVVASGAEDVHSFVEETLAERLGEVALKLHTGRSRNDQVATDLRLFVRQRASEIEVDLNRLLETLADLAQKHERVLLPGYTHLQRGQPVLFGHYVLAYGEMLLRDRERLREARARLNVCPLGSGAMSGTVYPIDRHTLARDLGFTAISENSLDGVSDRDFVLEFLFFAAVLMLHLSRMSEDLILFSSAEFGFVTLHDSIASGSSLMPQKKNPDALELVRGKTGRVYGHLVALLTVLKGLPMTYNKDLQEDKEGLFDSIRTVTDCVAMMRRVLERLELRPERMREAAQSGHLNATELADYLVARGMPFRQAHRLVGKIVVRAGELELPLERMSLTEYRSFSPLFEADVYGWLSLERAVARRTERGGTAPATVRRALARFRRRVQSAKSVAEKAQSSR